MKHDISKFEALFEEGYLRKSEKGNLVLYGYTDKTTFDRNWNEYTRNARGLILDKNTGECVAKPFPKFFNLGEMEETQIANLPIDYGHIAFDKVDGSLGIIFHHNGEWHISTRGSFYSEQAQKGAEILKKYNLETIDKDTTLLAEIIYPENKIIVNYGDQEKLVLLGAYDRVTEQEIKPLAVLILGERMGMECAEPSYGSIEQMIALQQTMPKDQEGFVVRFENGLRVKIKGAEYLRIAKMLSNMSPISFWEAMDLHGSVPKDYLAQLPEEFKAEFEPIVQELEAQYYAVKGDIISDAQRLPTQELTPEGKKAIGLFIQDPKNQVVHGPAIFPYVTGNKSALNKYILKQIRPTGNKLRRIGD